MKYIASCSFGKDSLAMILKLIEFKMPLDEVVFYDTGKEFNAIYNIRDKILNLLKNNNIKYIELKPKMSFDYMMFDKPVKKRGTQIIHKYGYGWCGGVCRWGTTEKLKAIDKYCKENNAICYIGIASDETNRINKERAEYKKLPLVDWNMTEKDCLEYCYKKGFDWNENGIELYDILDRVSCWCCRNKNLKELKGIYKYFPEYWNSLKDIENKLGENMKKDKSLTELEIKFNKNE